MKTGIRILVLIVVLVNTTLVSQSGGECPPDFAGYLPPRLQVNTDARVTPGGLPNRLRSEPSLSGEQIALIDPGTTIFIVGGPHCDSVNRVIWWQVTVDSRTGWTAEGLLPDEYFLEPLNLPTPTLSFPTATPIAPTNPPLPPPSAMATPIVPTLPLSGTAAPFVTATPYPTVPPPAPVTDLCRSYIAVMMGIHHLYILDTSTGEYLWVVSALEYDSRHEIDWSPDGSRLLVTARPDVDTPYGIYALNVDDQTIEEIATPGYGARWSPDGEAIAFYHEETSGLLKLNVIVGGAAPQPLADSSSYAWIPDGRLLVNGLVLADHFLLDVHTMAREPVTYAEVFIGNFIFPAPDGTRLAVDTAAELIVAERRGSVWETTRQLETYSYGVPVPYWSPDGLQLAYTGSMDGIFVYSSGEPLNLIDSWERDVPIEQAASGGEVVVSAWDQVYQLMGWSPDGSRILFSTVGIPEGELPAYLYAVSSDGARLELITPARHPDGTPTIIEQGAWSGCVD